MEKSLATIEGRLRTLEELNQRSLSKDQISKLYGFMEGYITNIDALDVSAGDDSHRDRRRQCVTKINLMLDSLHGLGDAARDMALSEARYPTYLGIAVGEEGAAARAGCAYLIDAELFHELSGNYANTVRLDTVAAAVVDGAKAAERVLLDRGLVADLSSSTVISTHALANLIPCHIQQTPSESEGLQRLPCTCVTHTHVALAAHISRFFSEMADSTPPQRYAFLSADSKHAFFSTICLRGAQVSFEHFSAHEIASSASAFTAAMANSILRSAISMHDLEWEREKFDLLSLNTVYQIGCASHCMDVFRAELSRAFPSIEWDGRTFGSSVNDIAVAEAKGAALLAQSAVIIRQPSMFSYGIRAAEDDSVDAATFFMPFIYHWSALPVTVTKLLEPSADPLASVDVCEFDIMTQSSMGAAVSTVWRHRVALSRGPSSVQLRLRVDEARSLFVSTCIEGVWSSETRVETVCNALEDPFDKANAVSVVGLAGEVVSGSDSGAIRRGWCCRDEAEILKNKGNSAFKEEKHLSDDFHLTALEWYSLAVCFNPGNHILYSNRAACAQKLGLYGLALSDSQASVRISPTFIKGLVRCGDASFCLEQFSDAVKHYKAALDAAPSPDVNDKMLAAIAQCEKADAENAQASERPSGNPRKKKKQEGKGSSCVIN